LGLILLRCVTMTYETVSYEVKDRVAVVTLNRPKSLNALNAQMGKDLGAALRAASTGRGVLVIVVTGAGRAFCSGGDLKAMAGGFASAGTHSREMEAILRNFHDVVSFLQQIDKPVVAAIHGPAVGAGMSIALACDLRIASEDATFSQAFVRIGLSPDGGSTWLLPRLIGPGRAAQLMMTGETLGTSRALEWGLVNHVVPEGEHLSRGLEFAQQLAALSPQAIASIKRLLRSSERNRFFEQLEAEAAEQNANAMTPEFRAALEAFFKRKPAS